MRALNKIIVHCADTPPSMDIGATEIKQWHVKENGWADIGYHDVIRRNGHIEKGRPLDTAGAHAYGYNADSIGICLVGGGGGKFDYTHQQLNALMNLISEYRHQYNPLMEVLGHCDVSGKPCPNFNVGEWFYGYYNAPNRR